MDLQEMEQKMKDLQRQMDEMKANGSQGGAQDIEAQLRGMLSQIEGMKHPPAFDQELARADHAVRQPRPDQGVAPSFSRQLQQDYNAAPYGQPAYSQQQVQHRGGYRSGLVGMSAPRQDSGRHSYGPAGQGVPPCPPRQFHPNGNFVPPGKEKKPRDMEAFVGKNVMGVMASILIFIGMAVFAALVLPAFPIAVRMLFLYFVSILVAGVGIWYLGVKQTPVWNLVAGVGTGAIFVSILLTDIVWLKDYGMPMHFLIYALILAWTGFMCFLGKKLDGPFCIIAQSGVAVAAVFGFLKGFSGSDSVMLSFVAAFFFSGIGGCIFAFRDKLASFASLPCTLFAAGSFATLFMEFGDADPSEYASFSVGAPYSSFMVPFLLFAAGTLAIVAYHMLLLREKQWVQVTGSVMAVLCLCSLAPCATNLPGAVTVAYCILCLCVATAASVSYGQEIVGSFPRYGFFLFPAFATAFAASACTVDLPGEVSPAFLFLIAGFLAAKLFGGKAGRITCYILFPMVLYSDAWSSFRLFGYWGYKPAPAFWYVARVSVILCLAFAQYTEKDRKSPFWWIGYPLQMVGLFSIVREAVDAFIFASAGEEALGGYTLHIDLSYFSAACVMFLVNMAVGSWIRRSRDDKGMEIAASVMNAFVMMSSLGFIATAGGSSYEGGVLMHILAVLLAAASFCYNFRTLLKWPAGSWYLGVKFSVLLWAVLDSFSVENYIISIAFFALAVAAVSVGFVWRNKSLRLFALVLSCVSVAKLTLLDISYESTALKALSFIVCGILCFGISVAYHKLMERSVPKE